jgi:hypothetical protein
MTADYQSIVLDGSSKTEFGQYGRTCYDQNRLPLSYVIPLPEILSSNSDLFRTAGITRSSEWYPVSLLNEP